MTYWLCITNRANWKVIKEKNVWGVPRRHRNTIARVKPGDKLLIYLKQERENKEVLEPKIVGIFEVVSEPYEDSSRIFKAHVPNETYPLRVRIKPVKLGGEVDFKPLIPKLKFITNKKRWSGHLMGKAMRKIPEEDYKLIESLL
ncbi:EVE domain-containing protein [Thermococcus peptonophilus]|uniref:EVE domain-containing protein n=1 Tax=Thermococcus peptonophilus TaxID=53952 RepID=UPI0006D04E0A